MNLDMEKIGRYLQASRRKMEMTQAQLAERLNVSAQSVSNWERGETLPDVSVLPDIAAILRCSVDAILSGGEPGGSGRFVTVAQMREAIECIHRLKDLMEAYLRYKLTPTRLLTVHPSPGKNASMILLAGKKGSPRAELKILPPLFLDNSDGRVNRIYEEEHTDCFI